MIAYTSDASSWNFGRLSDRSQPLYDAFRGFFQPVDNPPTLNKVKAGSAVPVKFSLGGDKGLGVFAEGYPRSRTISCDSEAPMDTIEQTVSASSSGLSYDTSSDQYTYVWKTHKSWTGCRQLEMVLKDGSLHEANFKLTK